jgi:hypothetical protein
MKERTCGTQYDRILLKNSKKELNRAPVAHICNPSCLGGRDQEDHGLKSRDPTPRKYLTQDRADGVAQVVECLLSKLRS